ncbi:nucleoside deaminase [Cohnella thailandensis]|uniref:Nucleoside deaminase n=1 Tax=Cohnella thailandensis TaxID=557557 RepID=A0A841SXM8_9BACL|nr:nucleoside deaminase [Cohnella thailandensis]MBB6636664.1 nucleoside deaminase [Cohnella thailandensis]MBP1973460.1 tRNA(Arg) A34 adenosine deaminase TadA [Cohnella thailandensis]
MIADKEQHVDFLRRAVEVSRKARESGNTPFGCILVDPRGQVLWEQGNIEITEHNCTGHAETTLMEAVSKRFSKQELWECTLYTTAEPCAMCAGSIYWGNVGRVVFGITEKRLAELTGDDEQNLTLDLPCTEVFAAGRKPIVVIGPFPEIEDEVVAVHAGYWK